MRRPSAGHLLAAVIAFLYLYPFPYFEEMGSANELPRVYLTSAMVDDGTFAIDRGVAEYRREYRHDPVDASPSGGHVYSNKAPGSSFLAVPAYLALQGVHAVVGGEVTVAQKTWAFRVATGVLPTLLFLLLLWRFLERYAPSPEARRAALAGYALGSMALIYSVLFIAHQLSAVCIASAWILGVWVVEGRLAPRWLLAVGFLGGMAPLVDYQAAFAGVPVAVYLVWKLVARASGSRPRRLARLGLAVAGSVPPIALLLFYHARAFGSPWRTGYAASESFAKYHQRGFLGMDELRWEAFTGSTVAPDNGLFLLCPMLLLALPGLWLLWRRRDRWTFGVCASVMVIYLLFISSLSFWRGGWQVGPRYITAMLPFAIVPVAVAIEAAWAATGRRAILLRGGAVALVGASMIIYALSAALFPHFPETFKNPVHELVLRLLAAGYAPWNAGWLLGLRGPASLVPYLLALLALLVWIAVPARNRILSGGLGLALAGALVAALALAPGGGKPAATSYWRITTWMPSGPEPTKRSP
ncbi:MAG TPA: hypothetical protein VMZ28_03625 [Kofleriaceae bacterium]|nr:hypothetical protein [Kofleriaceae bacterium]